jgi:hypothetical protein
MWIIELVTFTMAVLKRHNLQKKNMRKMVPVPLHALK